MNAEELDALLGDPLDAGNPLGFAAVLAADERQDMFAEGERLLDAAGLNAEFVPAAYGGRLTRADQLAHLLRALCRRDGCLGLGYGFSSFIATVNVWTSGDEAQCRRAAKLLMTGSRISAAFTELAHGNDVSAAAFTARRADGGWLLSGRKEVIANLRRSAAAVLFARTDDRRGSRAHSQFLVVKDDLPDDCHRYLPRYPSSGMRGVRLDGMEFADCPIPEASLIGTPGQGMEILLRSYHLTRALIPAIGVGSLDTALRAALACALERRLYGGVAADIPHARAVIARAFADLLAADAFASVVLRALHVAPEALPVYSPAVKYLTSRIAVDAVDDLRSVLGASGYLREGPYAIFQKVARDIRPATFAHASRATCLVMLLPQLPRLARRAWSAGEEAPPDLFDLGGPLPTLDFHALAVGTARGDAVLASLAGGEPCEGRVGRFEERFRQELRELRDRCVAMPPSDLTGTASPAAFDLADRYTVLLGAAMALAVWRRDPARLSETMLIAVLDRLTGRLAGPSVLSAAERDGVEQDMFEIAVERHRQNRLFDLTARQVPGGPMPPTWKAEHTHE